MRARTHTHTQKGHRYVFRFAANSYFENKEIFKEFKYTKETGDIAIDQVIGCLCVCGGGCG